MLNFAMIAQKGGTGKTKLGLDLAVAAVLSGLAMDTQPADPKS